MNIETKDENLTIPEEEQKSKKSLKITRRNLINIIVGVAVVAVIVALQFYKGVFVAATVDGRPVSRFSVISELENKSGKQALDSLITETLIKRETKNISISKEDIDGEIKKIEEQVASQGGTLDAALTQQGMTMGQLKEQVEVQKKLESLLADKVQVSDEEVAAYIKDNKITPPKGQKLEDIKIQIKEQLKKQKFGQVAQQWISDLKINAKIKYYVNY